MVADFLILFPVEVESFCNNAAAVSTSAFGSWPVRVPEDPLMMKKKMMKMKTAGSGVYTLPQSFDSFSPLVLSAFHRSRGEATERRWEAPFFWFFQNWEASAGWRRRRWRPSPSYLIPSEESSVPHTSLAASKYNYDYDEDDDEEEEEDALVLAARANRKFSICVKGGSAFLLSTKWVKIWITCGFFLKWCCNVGLQLNPPLPWKQRAPPLWEGCPPSTPPSLTAWAPLVLYPVMHFFPF